MLVFVGGLVEFDTIRIKQRIIGLLTKRIT